MHLLTGDYLFNTPTDESGYFLALTIVFALLFIASAFAYLRRAKLAGDNPILRRVIRRAARAGMWTAGIGLFLALMRYTQVPYLSMPIWMLLLIIAMIVIVGFFVYDLSERYPLAVHQLRESHRERRFRPTPKPRAEPQRPKAAVRGKRRR